MNPTEVHRLLVVDDEPDLCTLYELTLVREGYGVDTAETVSQALALLRQHSYSALITDMRLPDGTGLELLQHLEREVRNEKAIVITAFGSAENAVEALKAGAYDYLTKPVDLRQFRSVVASALGRVGTPAASVPRKREAQVAKLSAMERLAGASAAMDQVRHLIGKVARSMAPVLVNGESGTGKELVARGIHDQSPRGDMPFVAVNCSAIPEHLLEAEFFGFRKGSFTGAGEDREGFFQAAHGGTLFLDEIGDLPLAMQSKLLRVIQERAVRSIGAVSEVPVNVRIVSATHKDLSDEVQSGRFRQDLFYRLNVIQIRIPPLRERLDDLQAICTAVLHRLAQDAGVVPAPVLSRAALEALRQHSFPGNVRELENLLHRAVALSGQDIIDVDDLGLEPASPAPALAGAVLAPIATAPPQEVPVPQPSAAAALLAPHQAPAAVAALPQDLQTHLDDVERDILERALELHRYNRTAAGASLGLTLRQMRYRMARLGIQSGDATGERGEAL